MRHLRFFMLVAMALAGAGCAVHVDRYDDGSQLWTVDTGTVSILVDVDYEDGPWRLTVR